MATTKLKATEVVEKRIKEVTELSKMEIQSVSVELETRRNKYKEAKAIAENTKVINATDAEKIVDAKVVATREKEIIDFLEERLEKVEKKELISSTEAASLISELKKEAIQEQQACAAEMIQLADKLYQLGKAYETSGHYIDELIARLHSELLRKDTPPQSIFNGEIYFFSNLLKNNNVYEELKNLVSTGSMR